MGGDAGHEMAGSLLVGAGAAGALATAWVCERLRLARSAASPEPPRAADVLMVPLERLERFAAQVFESCGVPTNEAATAAKVLLMADLRGIDSHGIARLCAYHGMLREGLINPTPRVKIVRETASTATVDGDNGLGLVVGPQANAIAIQKAEQAGSGWVSVKNTNHYGIAGAYSLQALEHGMIGISMTNSSSVVAPLYGKERFLGTNPIAIAFPGEHEKPIVIDMATSVVPWGKVEEYARMDSPLLPGWAIDSTGHTALNPEAVLKDGALMNLGGAREHSGHKGFAWRPWSTYSVLCFQEAIGVLRLTGSRPTKPTVAANPPRKSVGMVQLGLVTSL